MTANELKAALLAVAPDELLEGFIDLGDGYRLTAELEPDSESSINDYDCHGRIQWHHGSGRPEGFDGSAEKLERDRGAALWWLPYREGRRVYNTPKDRAIVQRLVADGFYVLVVSLVGPAQHIAGTATVEIATAAVGGIDTDESEHLGQLAGELIDELVAQL